MRVFLILVCIVWCHIAYSQTFNRTYNFGKGGWGMSLAIHEENLVLNTLENCPYNCTHVMLISSVNGEVLADRYFYDEKLEFRTTAQHSNVRVGDRYYTSGGYQKISTLETDMMLLVYTEDLDSVRLARYRDSTFRAFGWTLVAHEDKIYSWGIAGLDNKFYHGLMVCSDLDGEMLWMKRYKDDYIASFEGSITNSHDGHFITTVRANLQNEKYRVVVRKITSEGDVLWKKEHAFSYYTSIREVTLTTLGSDNYILICQQDTIIYFPEENFWDGQPTMAYVLNEEGDRISTTVSTKPYHYRYYQNVVPTKDGGAIAAGWAQIGIEQMGVMTRYDASGTVVWDKWYRHLDFLKPGNGIPDRFEGRFNKATELPDGRIAVTGPILFVPQSHTWVMVLDSMGCLEPGCADGLQSVSSITGTESVDLPTSMMRLAPNPATDEVTIWSGYETSDVGGHLRIYDLHGRVIMEQKGIQPVQTLTTGHLLGGIYIVAMEGSYGYEAQKLIIK